MKSIKNKQQLLKFKYYYSLYFIHYILIILCKV